MAGPQTKFARECVAAYIAEGLYPIDGRDSISTRCNVTPVTIHKWKKQDEGFIARVEELRQEARDAVKDMFIAQRENRIKLYNNQALELLRLKAARAETHADDPEMPGGNTGTLVKKKTSRRETRIRGEDNSEIITVEVNYDRAVDAELRELAKQAAIEQGDWTEKKEHTGAGGTPLIPIREVLIDMSAGNIPEE